MNDELEREFGNTTRLLLGSTLHGLEGYKDWIGRRVPLSKETKSAVSGKEVWMPPSLIYLGKEFNLENAISLDEIDAVNKTTVQPEDLPGASVKDIIGKFIEPVCYHIGNMRYQAHENVWKCSGAGGGRNLLYCDDVYLDVKNVAYSNYALWCINAFGCHGVMNSGFIIHAYNSNKISRCFEVDGCSNSSGLMFCHNCENVHDSMFCFNAKNLRNAIGNVQTTPDKFKLVKEMVQKEIAEELEKTRFLQMDIFNIGSMREGLWHRKLTKH